MQPRITNGRGDVISGPGAPSAPAAAEAPGERFVVETIPDGRWTMRSGAGSRYEAAKTTRLNSAQWAYAHDRPINEELSGALEDLRARCEYEAANNSMIFGAIYSHQVDVVGEHGPTLQIEVLDEDWTEEDKQAYADAREAVWSDWFECPDAAGLRSGVEMLRMWVRQIWTRGEFFEQFVTKTEVGKAITLRLLPIATQRVRTPHDRIGDDENVVMGVHRNFYGQPLRYYVDETHRTGDYTQFGPDSEPVPADLMLHGYVQQEPDQARGVPLLACNLQETADLRQFDEFVLDAAKAAASQGIYLFTNHPDAPFISVDASVELERNTQSTMPPGWQPYQLQPGQPAANYKEFRQEKHIGLGRPASMPNLTLRADASNHNFSSAHFDSQGYQRANGVLHDRLGKYLKRLEAEVNQEARLLAAAAGDRRIPAILARMPKRVRVTFKGWPVQTHVDPSKVRKGNEIGLKTMQIAPSDAWAADGHEFDKQLGKLQREYKRMAAIQITPEMSMLDLFLASLRPPNDPLAATVDEDGTAQEEDDADEPTPQRARQEAMA